MQRNMPAHLQKYQQSGFIPKHAEKAFSQHLKKNLPGHMQQYADAYIQQKVVWGNNPEHISAPTTVAQPAAHNEFLHEARNSEEFHYGSQEGTKPDEPAPSFGGEVGTQTEGNQYDFILNPQKSLGRRFTLPGNSTAQRVIIGVGGLVIVIFLYSFISGFLNKEGSAQKDRLIALAQTQYEIVRVANEASQKITDKNILYKSVTVKASVQSSQNEIIAALKNRVNKVSIKQINVKNPQDDTVLQQGEDNGRYDQTYDQLLQKQLTQYKDRLQAVYNSGDSAEKNIALSASNQLKLILNDKSS